MFSKTNRVLAAVCGIAPLIALMWWDHGRYVFIYNALPLLVSACFITILARTLPPKILLSGIIVFALIINGVNLATSEIHLEGDSLGYISAAHDFAAGHQADAGAIFRPPLYAFILGLTFLGGASSLLSILILQHLLLVGCAWLVYRLGLGCSLDHTTSALAAFFFSINSFSMHLAQSVMSETVFTVLLLCSLCALVRLIKKPSFLSAIAVGMAFGAAAYARGLLLPVLMAGIAVLFWKYRQRALRFAVITGAVYGLLIMPGLLHNQLLYGTFSMSAQTGPVLFTKLSSFKLEDPHGESYRCIRDPLRNVVADLGLTGYRVADYPEDDWQLNRVPHVLMDSLRVRHGYSFVNAGRLLTAASLEGFARHPARYACSVLRSLNTMLFTHREYYPDPRQIMSLAALKGPSPLARVVRGFFYIDGLLWILLPCIALVVRNIPAGVWIFYGVAWYGYLLTALVQIGFTRYTVPWIPVVSLCTAAAFASVIRLGCSAVSGLRKSEIRMGCGVKKTPYY